MWPWLSEEFDSIINDLSVPEADAHVMLDVFYGTYLSMYLAIPRYGDGSEFAKVKIVWGTWKGWQSAEPRTTEYKYKSKASLTSNEIAENIFAQVDGEKKSSHPILWDCLP